MGSVGNGFDICNVSSVVCLDDDVGGLGPKASAKESLQARADVLVTAGGTTDVDVFFRASSFQRWLCKSWRDARPS